MPARLGQGKGQQLVDVLQAGRPGQGELAAQRLAGFEGVGLAGHGPGLAVAGPQQCGRHGVLPHHLAVLQHLEARLQAVEGETQHGIGLLAGADLAAQGIGEAGGKVGGHADGEQHGGHRQHLIPGLNRVPAPHLEGGHMGHHQLKAQAQGRGSAGGGQGGAAGQQGGQQDREDIEADEGTVGPPRRPQHQAEGAGVEQGLAEVQGGRVAAAAAPDPEVGGRTQGHGDGHHPHIDARHQPRLGKDGPRAHPQQGEPAQPDEPQDADRVRLALHWSANVPKTKRLLCRATRGRRRHR